MPALELCSETYNTSACEELCLQTPIQPLSTIQLHAQLLEAFESTSLTLAEYTETAKAEAALAATLAVASSEEQPAQVMQHQSRYHADTQTG